MSSGAQALVDALAEQEVDVIFGVCGDTSVEFYRELSKDDRMEHVLTRDERNAAIMADVYARLSDKPGVCEGPSGGGATFLLGGVAEPQGSSIPVVALNTTIPVKYRDRGVLTEIDQKRLFEPVTKWNTSADHPDLVPRLVRQAFRKSTTGRPGVTHLSFPMDVLNGTTEESVYPDSEATRYPSYRAEPSPERIEEAAKLLAESERPVAVAGGGIHSSRAWEEVREFAEKTGIPVAQTLTSAGCIGESPYSIGVVGENGSREYANEIVSESDTVLLLGTAVESVWTDKWSKPADGAKTMIRIDVDGESIGKNYQTDVAIPADLKVAVERLTEAVSFDQKWDAGTLQNRHESWIGEFASEFDSDDFPLRPERLVAGAREVLDDDAVLVADPGTATPYFASLYPFTKPGRHWVTNRYHGALGYSLPGAIGAHYARPDSQVVALSGDGSFGMSVGELETYGRLDLPITLVVVNNAAFSWIEAGQRNYDDFSFGVDFSELDYAGIAEQFGLSGFRVESADEYEETLAEAVELDGPAVVDVPTKALPEIDNVPVSWLEPDE